MGKCGSFNPVKKTADFVCIYCHLDGGFPDDAKLYNAELKRASEGGHGTWFTASWLFAECYMCVTVVHHSMFLSHSYLSFANMKQVSSNSNPLRFRPPLELFRPLPSSQIISLPFIPFFHCISLNFPAHPDHTRTCRKYGTASR